MRYVTSIERLGRKKGLRQGLTLVLRKQLNQRFGELPAWAEERLADASLEELEHSAERVLEAQRLEDVFAVD